MNLIKTALLLFILLTVNFLHSQQFYQKAIGGTSNETFRAVKQTSDGGFIFAGNTLSFGPGGTDFYVMKTDINGDTLWTKTYGETSIDDGYDIDELAGGGYIVVGQSNFLSTSSEVLLINIDANGNILWSKTYGGTLNDRGIKVRQTSDLGFIIGGITFSYGNIAQFYLIKTDINGNVLWTNVFGGTDNEYLYGLDITSDGGFIMVGQTASYGVGSSDVFAVKTDSLGSEQWSASYGMAGSEFGYFVEETFDGGYIIAGSTNSAGAGSWDAFLIKLNSVGNLLWTKTFGDTGNDFGWEVHETNDNGFILISQANSLGYGLDDAMLIKTDNNGNLAWAKVFGGIQNDFFYAGCITTDNGFMLTGQTRSFGSGNYDNYFVRTDSLGFAYNCYSIDITPTVNSPVFIQNATALLTATGATENTIAVIELPTNSIIDDICPCYINHTLTVTDALCFGDNNGSAYVSPSGGTLPYNFLWSTASNNDTIGNLIAGDYYVIVSDMYGCTTSDTAHVLQPLQLTDTFNVVNVNCFGGSDGSAIVNIAGGTSPYGYLWSDLGTSDTLSNASAGMYYITVVDDHFCVLIDSVEVTEPTELFIDSISQTDVLCFGDSTGTAQIYDSGGTAPYYYSWSNGDTLANTQNIPYGWFYVTLTDNNACAKNDSVFIDQPNLLIDSLLAQNISCFNDSNGTAISIPSGGIMPYTYLWSNGNTNDTISNLYPGTFYLTITDNNLCVLTDSIVITEPTELFIDSISQTDVLCFGDSTGTAQIYDSGGTIPYYYNWSNGDTLANAQNMPYGWFYITLTDDNACTKNDSIFIDQPNALIDSLLTQNISCFNDSNGTAISIPSGGIMPYTYLWSNSSTNDTILNLYPGTFYLTITDNNFCTYIDTAVITEPSILEVLITQNNVTCFGFSNGNANSFVTGGTTPYTYLWSNGDTLDYINGVTASLYYLTITDTNNCVTVDSINITEPTQLLVVDSVVDVLCYGDSTGMIFLDVSGGTTPYNYYWFNSSANSHITGLPMGTYAVTVTDDNGCIVQIPKIDVEEPDLLVVYLDYTMPLCYDFSDGIVNSYVSGGIEPYSYLWDDGETDSVLTNITSNNYFLTVTDYNACTSTDTIFVTQPELLTLADSIYITNFFGNIDITTNGGTFPYNYLWSNNETSENINGLISGTYQVTVKDFNNCEIIGIYTIDIPFDIPTLITPNGDGYNDNWQITNLNYYPDISIEIFNRWGDIVFIFTGSGFEYDNNRWDGTCDGKELPMAGYVYILDLKNGIKPYNGVVTIKR